MEYRPFGRTGLDVSAIGFGCWEIGGGYGEIEEAEFEPAVHARSTRHQLLRHRRGLRHGHFGARARPGARRAGATSRPSSPSSAWATRTSRTAATAAARAIMASIDKSLRNLGTDHVDVYLVHWPDLNTPFEETMSALDDVVRQGKVRFVGVSNFRLDADRGVHEAAADRRRAVRLEHVRPPDAARDLPVVRSATASASWRTARSPTGC